MTSAPANKKRDRDSASGPCDFVNFIVGGRYFSVRSALIAEYPDSYLSSAVKKEWRSEGDGVINIDRDGSLFEYVVEFHNCGLLPLRKVLLSMETLKAIQDEADFYNIADMVEACNAYILQQVDKHSRSIDIVTIYNMWADEWDGDKADKPTPLDTTIRKIWSPACFINYVPPAEADKQTIHNALVGNIAELALTAQRAELCSCAYIDAAQLNSAAVQVISRRFSHVDSFFTAKECIYTRPWRLLIVSEGECMGGVVESSTEDNLAGVLLYILNSDFEGGELIVNHHNKSVSISKQFQFMFVAKGCPYQHKVVRSGTQVVFALNVFYGRDKDDHEVIENIGGHTYLWEEVTPLTNDTQFVACKMLAGISMPLPARARDKIYAELSSGLAKHDTVVVCLTHYYPILQCTPECFTHGDSVVYGLLNEFLQTEVGSAFEMSLSLVGIEYHINTESECEFCCVAYGSVKDLTSAPYANGRLDETVKLIVPKLCYSNERFGTITAYSSEGPVEGTDHLFLGLKIAKKCSSNLR